MGALVDAARQARDDDVAGLAEAARQPISEGQTRRRGVTRTDDGDGGLLRRLIPSAHGEDGRRRIDLAQRGGISRLVESDEAHADFLRRRKFALDLLDAGDADRP
jgi:hypothetical protein